MQYPIPLLIHGYIFKGLLGNKNPVPVDKKEICAVSNTGIYCSSDKVGTVYLVYYIFKNSVNISALFTLCEDSISAYLVLVKMCSVFHNTDSHAGGKDNIGRQIQTTVQ
jgi:hypothetical protein